MRILIFSEEGYENHGVIMEGAFRAIGHEALRFYHPWVKTWRDYWFKVLVRSRYTTETKKLWNEIKGIRGEAYVAKILEYKPDLVLIVDFAGITGEQIRHVVKDLGIPVAWWVMGDEGTVSGYAAFNLATSRECSHLFIADTSWWPSFNMIGESKLYYLPFSVDTTLYYPLQEKRLYDVGICAAFQAEVPTVLQKGAVLDALAANGVHVRAVCRGIRKYDYLFPHLKDLDVVNEVYFAPQVNELYGQSIISLTLNNPQAKDDPHERVFESGAGKNFQLSEFRRNTEELMEGTVPQFKDLRELVVMTKHYLNHPAERKVSAEKAYEVIMRRHTAKHRAQEIIDKVFHS